MEEFPGPGVSVAYDEKGQPTKAALGFARGKGLDVADLTRKQTPKGEVVCALIKNKGRPTSSLLNDYLPQLIHEIPFQKKMRWANNSSRFARPLHWVVALFDGKALEFEFDGIANDVHTPNFDVNEDCILTAVEFLEKTINIYFEKTEDLFHEK